MTLDPTVSRVSLQVTLPALPDDAPGPNTPHPANKKRQAFWELSDDLRSGTERIREKAATYLPKLPAEDDDDWKARIARTYLFPGFASSVSGLTGIVFARPPQVDPKAPAEVLLHTQNIDNAGTHLEVFARTIFENGLADGLGAIVVDYPKLSDGATLDDERRSGARPYWIHYTAANIVNWRHEWIEGRLYLSLLALAEEFDDASGMFGTAKVKQIRVYRRQIFAGVGPVVSVEVWRPATTGKWVIFSGPDIVRNQVEIPASFFYGGRKIAPLQAIPPLEDLAHLNVAHLHTLGDHRTALHYAAIPILFGAGMEDDPKKPLKIAVNSAVRAANENATLSWVAAPTAAIGETRAELKDLEMRMAALGVSMLFRETRAAETAEAKRIDRGEQDSRLAVAARGLRDCLELAMVYHVRFLRLPDERAPVVSVNLEFSDLSMDPAELTAWLAARTQGDLSRQTFWEILAAKRAFPDSIAFDPEEEERRLEAENGLPPIPDDIPELPAGGKA